MKNPGKREERFVEELKGFERICKELPQIREIRQS
jgi:hypothetical protein